MFNNLPPEQMVVGLGMIAALLYKIWQIIKSDRRQDKSEAAEDSFRDDLLKEVTQLRTDLKSAHEEQLKSARREAELSAEVKILSKQVEMLIAQVSNLQGLLEDCKRKMNESCDNCKYKQLT